MRKLVIFFQNTIKLIVVNLIKRKTSRIAKILIHDCIVEVAVHRKIFIVAILIFGASLFCCRLFRNAFRIKGTPEAKLKKDENHRGNKKLKRRLLGMASGRCGSPNVLSDLSCGGNNQNIDCSAIFSPQNENTSPHKVSRAFSKHLLLLSLRLGRTRIVVLPGFSTRTRVLRLSDVYIYNFQRES